MRYLFLLLFFTSIFTKGQIVVDNNVPYNDPTTLVDNILLGGGIIASSHSFQGATAQIGWFNAQNTSLGLDSGIILSTGDIYSIEKFNEISKTKIDLFEKLIFDIKQNNIRKKLKIRYDNVNCARMTILRRYLIHNCMILFFNLGSQQKVM